MEGRLALRPASLEGLPDGEKTQSASRASPPRRPALLTLPIILERGRRHERENRQQTSRTSRKGSLLSNFVK